MFLIKLLDSCYDENIIFDHKIIKHEDAIRTLFKHNKIHCIQSQQNDDGYVSKESFDYINRLIKNNTFGSKDKMRKYYGHIKYTQFFKITFNSITIKNKKITLSKNQ
ncbi:hypothetical protein ACFL0U_01475 [Pseudomonadota bacterium]